MHSDSVDNSSSELSDEESTDIEAIDEAIDIEEFAPETSEIDRSIQEQDRPNIRESQESTRSTLAISLFITYLVTTISALIFASCADINTDDRKQIVLLIVTSQVTLMGSALGFYFGKNS